MYHRDWLMRQIEMIAATLGYVLFGVKTHITQVEELPDTVSGQNDLSSHLLAPVGAGEFCRAEDELFAALEAGDPEAPAAAVEFYAALNRLPDEVLEAGNFPRDEIEAGLRSVCDTLGLSESLFPGESAGS